MDYARNLQASSSDISTADSNDPFRLVSLDMELVQNCAGHLGECSAEDLKQTKVTQPAVFLHSVVKAKMAGDAFQPDMVAGHSLGEFSALVSAGALSFEDGLLLVQKRANAMQKACEANPGTMAAIVGLEDPLVDETCNQFFNFWKTID